MITKTQLKAESLENQVYEAIKADIVAGALRPGDRVVESQLSERFGISKTPVREALIRLKRDGLVEAEMHRINRVRTPTADDISQACEARAWIEAELAARCASDPPPGVIEQLRESIAAAEDALERDDAEDYGEAVRNFSDVITEASGNQFAAQLLEQLRSVLVLIAHIARKTEGRRERSIEEHIAIFEAIESRDPEAAAKATRRHLASIERDSLQALELLEQSG